MKQERNSRVRWSTWLGDVMIINTDKIKFRTLTDRGYIAVYGTQDNPYSSDYDLLTPDEARNMASCLDGIVDKLKDEAERLRRMAESPNEKAQ